MRTIAIALLTVAFLASAAPATQTGSTLKVTCMSDGSMSIDAVPAKNP